MPAALSYPGVYVEEIPSGVHTIVGVATSVTAFIGRSVRGPVDTAVDILSPGDFERTFGPLSLDSTMSFAVRDFFQNGGARAVIIRLYHPSAADDVAAVANAAAAAANGKDAKTAAAAALLKITGDATATDTEKAAATSANAIIAALADNATPADIAAAVQQARAAPLPDSSRVIPVDTLSFRAVSPGAWAGYLRIQVSAASGLGAASVATQLNLNLAQLFNLTVTDAGTGANETYLNVTVVNSPRRIDKVLADASSLIAWNGVDLDKGPVPALPDFSKITGDAVGAAYAAWTAAAAANPDPTSDPVKNAKKAYDTAVQAALKTADDGGGLTFADFLKPNGATNKTGLYALEQLYTRDGIFNLLCIPPYKPDANVDSNVVAAAGAYCETRRAMLLLDSPTSWTTVAKANSDFSGETDNIGYRGANGAIFFPRLMMQNPLHDNQIESFAACGTVAGIFARTDTARGVWKTPAGLDASLMGVSALAVPMTDAENGLLNPLGINCLRSFPVYGRVVWGGRTLRGADVLAADYKYTAVRRTALFIEESLYRALKWVVFEPNDEPLWGQIRLNVGAFMHDLFRQGAFQGQSARDAYFVKCDSSTTTQNDINLGIVNIVVGFAPLKPAEFVVIQLQQIAGQIDT